MTWESGAYRVSYFKPEALRRYLPSALAARLEHGSDEFELHLVPSVPGERNFAYDALYHLLSLRTLRRYRCRFASVACGRRTPAGRVPTADRHPRQRGYSELSRTTSGHCCRPRRRFEH